MTIAEKLTEVLQIKHRIRTAIGEKGAPIDRATPFSAYPDRIAAIPTGGISCALATACSQNNRQTGFSVPFPGVQLTVTAE